LKKLAHERDRAMNKRLQAKLTGQHRTESQLKASEKRFRILFERTPVAITINRNGRTLFVNQAYVTMFGYNSHMELIGTPVVNQIVLGDCAIGNVLRKRVKTESMLVSHETAGLRKDGSTFPLLVQVNTIDLPDGPANVGFYSDITARKQAEATLQSQVASQALLLEISKNFNNIMVEDIDDIINTTLRMIGEFANNDSGYVFLFSDDQSTINNTYQWYAEGIAATMYSVQGLPWRDMNLQSVEYIYYPRVVDLPPEAQAEKEILQGQSIQSIIVVPMFLEDKIIGVLGFDSVRSAQTWSEDNIVIFKSVAQIISKALLRQKFARDLLASENYYRAIFENNGAATMVIEEDMSITMVNEECQRLLGYAKEDLIGKKWTDFIPSDTVETMKEYHHLRQINITGVPLKYQTRIIDRQGNHQDGLLAVDIISGTNKSVVNFIDFTEFNRIFRALKAISAVNMTMIQAENEDDLLQNVCQKIMDVGGYSLVSVVYLQDDQRQRVQPVAYAGNDNGYLAKLNITLQDPKRGWGPIGTAIRTSQPVVSRDLTPDDTFKPWLNDASRQGFKSFMAIPLMVDNKAFGALSIYSSETGRFDSNEEILLIEMANDLGYAITFLRNRSEKNQTAQKLKMSLEKMQRILMQAVTSLGNTLEGRDPYTAGHQRKVAQLATSIATEMGFSKAQIDGIAVAGNLHDIGKINVPSEILSKPGKLSDLEFAIIKTHCQAGYEIIKDIEFPWPVAEILLQHHERMNGSGYPRGLAGEAILMEARIMAVADLVEAMASHRPYRPALGKDAALDEISKNRASLYDPEVVDACLKVFREKGFNWNNQHSI
jgi:PAS domain S-box-containing protein/putative nucleotidyltransferase with HDIG domain